MLIFGMKSRKTSFDKSHVFSCLGALFTSVECRKGGLGSEVTFTSIFLTYAIGTAAIHLIDGWQ